jgi:hypothetical protein
MLLITVNFNWYILVYKVPFSIAYLTQGAGVIKNSNRYVYFKARCIDISNMLFNFAPCRSLQ